MEKDIYFKYIKLVSGDNIVCTTTDNCENVYKQKTISVTDPVVLNPVRIPKGDVLVESYVMYPWFSFSEEIEYKIPTSQVILVVNIKDTLKKNYLRYLEMQDDDVDIIDNDIFVDDDADEIDEFLNEMGEENENKENGGTDGFGNRRRTIH
jgi:hypothetical protein